MSGLSGEKQDLRDEIRARAGRLLPGRKAAWDRELSRRLLKLPAVLRAECVYAYASLKSEPGTWDFLAAVLGSGKRLALPRVDGGRMAFFYVESLDGLIKRGAFHIPEPGPGSLPARDLRALVVVPGMAFTRGGARLGKGGGYYDRFLFREPDHETVGLAYEFQIVERLPADPWDLSVDLVVTPEAVYARGKGLCGAAAKDDGDLE